MADTETLTLSHNDGGLVTGRKIRVTIKADHGRWGEARSLRSDIRKVLRDEAEVVEFADD